MKIVVIALIVFFLSILFPFQNEVTISTDPIVGNWKIEKIIYFKSDDTSYDEVPVRCSNSKVFSYMEDGTLSFRSFELNSETNACTVPSNDYWEGTWEKTSNGNYIRTLTYKYSNKTHSRYVDSVGTFIFSNQNKTMTQMTTYKISGIAMDATSDLIAEHTVFKRMD